MKYCDKFIVINYEELDSTQLEVKRLLKEEKIIPGTVIATSNQTNGYARRQREWLSTKGNLAASLLIKCSQNIPVTQLSYVVGLAIARSIIHLNNDLAVNVKWVNDILINQKKVSGILLEKIYNDFIIIGFGVNIKKIFNANFECTSLEDFKVKVSYNTLLHLILNEFVQIYEEWINNGFESIRSEWLYRAVGINKKIVVNYSTTSETGVFVGIDELGNLQLMQNNKIKNISAGEIFVI